MSPVYHGSPEGGLTRLRPRAFTHAKAYVYAAREPLTALIFARHWNDFILNLSLGSDGRPELTERYKCAFDEVFSGKPGWLYTLPDESFIEGATSFPGEVVSEREVCPLSSLYFADLGAELLQAAARGELRLYRYPDRPDFIPADDRDLCEEALTIAKRDPAVIPYCLGLHPQLKRFFEAKNERNNKTL